MHGEMKSTRLIEPVRNLLFDSLIYFYQNARHKPNKKRVTQDVWGQFLCEVNCRFIRVVRSRPVAHLAAMASGNAWYDLWGAGLCGRSCGAGRTCATYGSYGALTCARDSFG